MRSTLLPLLALATVACSTGSDTAADTARADTAAVAAAPAAPTVTDPQIAAIVVAANNADIEAGRVAASKSSNAKVKEFAQRMITDHGGVNKSAVELVTKLGVTPEENPASQQQKAAGEQNIASLQGKTGAEFDRAYMAYEVTYHENLLKAIDETLLPSVQNAELKALLDQTRPAVVSHLEHARTLQASLGQG